MEITKNIQTPTALSIPSSVRPASGFGMPNGGQSCFGVLADTRTSWIRTTGLMTEGTDARTRKDLAAKGHVALVAYVPGYLAWSPPIC
ncbi:hypothetical protein [Nocardioides sp.]|uniref:hypothetical protein n=1 Tax=Nocardioides sp. TaxID=35761 RepID=UPI00271F279E|nr:hypothetical protein [Nocardioides sp.]MDO9458059.1 hypothetical protein [Nocardioides sp.]